MAGTPSRQKAAYGIPAALKGSNPKNIQEVWGCGTFGVNKTELGMFYNAYCPTCTVDQVQYGTENHGKEGGDNFLEGTLDTSYITAFAPGVLTINSNTNTSMATEEGEAQGVATVYAMDQIAARVDGLPLVLSLSLGSLGFDSCDALCSELQASTTFTYKECHDYIQKQRQKQRQVYLYASNAQQERINTAFKVMGMRGTTVFGASGDGGSHWSFGEFSSEDPIGAALNTVGCNRMSPLFPANSPYIVAVGSLAWPGGDAANPVAWSCAPGSEGGSGGGFSGVWRVNTHARTHARRRNDAHARTQRVNAPCARTHARTQTHAYTRTHNVHTRTQRAHTHTHTHVRTHRHTRTRAHTRTRTHNVHTHA